MLFGFRKILVAFAALCLIVPAQAQMVQMKRPPAVPAPEPPPVTQMAANPVVALTAEMNKAWERKDGCAKRIAIVLPDHPFVTGCGDAAMTQVYFMDKNQWSPIGGDARAVGARIGDLPGANGKSHFEVRGREGLFGYDPAGNPAVQYTSHPDDCFVEAASGVARGMAGLETWTWALGCESGGLDKPIKRRTSTARKDGGFMEGYSQDNSFQAYPGAAVRLAVGLNDSVAWVANSNGEIYRQIYCKGSDPDERLMLTCTGIGNGWEQIPGCAKAIANGGDNRVWVIGCDADSLGNGTVYQYVGPDSGQFSTGRWTKRAGRGVDIAVDNQGRPWVVTADGGIWRWAGAVPAKGQRIDSDPPQARAADPR